MSETARSPQYWADQGSRKYQSKDYEAAAQDFARAAEAFSQADDVVKAAEMANNQAVALMQLDKPQKALEILAGTPDIFREAGQERLTAQAHGNLAQAFAEDGQPTKAQDHFQAAIDIFERLNDLEGLQHSAKGLSRLHLTQGDALGALYTMQQGLEPGSSLSIRDRLLRWLLRIPARFLSGS